MTKEDADLLATLDGEGGSRARCPATPLLLEDLEDGARTVLRGGGGEHLPQRARGAALLADDLAEVFDRDLELEHERAVFLDGMHLHLVGTIDEVAGEEPATRPASAVSVFGQALKTLRHGVRRLAVWRLLRLGDLLLGDLLFGDLLLGDLLLGDMLGEPFG